MSLINGHDTSTVQIIESVFILWPQHICSSRRKEVNKQVRERSSRQFVRFRTGSV